MKIEVLEGEWKAGGLNDGVLRLITKEGKMERFSEIKNFEEITEENKTEWKRKIGWGVGVGLVTFGVGGLVTGILIGNKKVVEFFCELPDGRAFVGRMPKKGLLPMVRLCPPERQKELAEGMPDL